MQAGDYRNDIYLVNRLEQIESRISTLEGELNNLGQMIGEIQDAINQLKGEGK